MSLLTAYPQQCWFFAKVRLTSLFHYPDSNLRTSIKAFVNLWCVFRRRALDHRYNACMTVRITLCGHH